MDKSPESSPPGGTSSIVSSNGLLRPPMVGHPVSALGSSICSDRINPTLSVTSLASRATGRSAGAVSKSPSTAPPSAGYSEGGRQRRFVSRHVPEAAEILAKTEVLSPDIVSRFSGLMRHLKPNTEWEEHLKQVMVSTMADMVPEQYEETVRAEFERRCSFGERMNTEFMTSAKWVRLMKDIGAISPTDSDRRGGATSSTASLSENTSGQLELAEADIVFKKVLHDCDYGGKRLTYELFCKAMYIVARTVRQDLDSEAAYAELLARLVAVAPEEEQKGWEKDVMLDGNVLLVLDHFKPALYDLFTTFCGRYLSNCSDGSHGLGSTRIRERSVWKHTQDTVLSGTHVTSASFYRDRGAGMGSSRSTHGVGGGSLATPSKQVGVEAAHVGNGLGASEDAPKALQVGPANEADAGGGYAETRPTEPAEVDDKPSTEQQLQQKLVDLQREQQAQQQQLQEQHLRQQQQLMAEYQQQLQPGDSQVPPCQQQALQVQRPLSASGYGGGTAMDRTVCSSVGMGSTAPSQQDPYVYANGAPVIANRRKHMSIEQLHAMCRELKIFPDLLSRVEIVNIFKRAQCAGASSSHGNSSLYGYLNKEAFVDCAGQLALEAYSKSPYAEEYPQPHERIHAFFLSVLPSSSREVHDRFLYGCSGRGRMT